MPLIELATESGGNYGGNHIEAMRSHADMIQSYVDHMKKRNRDLSFLLRLPPFSGDNVVTCLEKVAEELRERAHSDDEARKKIEQAAESIIQFLTDLELFREEPIIAFESEVVSEGIDKALKRSLGKAHDTAEKYAKDPNVPNAENACMTNREAIVYLYIARFGYEEIINQEELRKFHTDINRAIYYNRFLQQTPAVQSGKEETGSDYELLDKHTDSEIRRLRLLQTIIDNDIQQTQVLLRIALKKAFPDIQF
ncbi:MAG: hypothetical protein ACYTEK_15420 [Planctomycetota bacterium]|jgi:cell division protein ZapA (FtsZ GTPase activity inhibitor)